MSDASVMIVEDEIIVAEDLGRNLAACGYQVVGQAMDGTEAIHMARELHPDIVLMDIYLNGHKDGIRAARAIQRHVAASIIFVSAHSTDSLVNDAVRAGASGYVVKPFQLSQITSAIEIALRRRKEGPLERSVDSSDGTAEWVLEVGRRDSASARQGELAPEAYDTLQRLQLLVASDDLWAALTDGRIHMAMQPVRITSRESQVIRWLLCYRRIGTVAGMMGISVNTARKHLKSAFSKLNVHSQEELVRLFVEEIAVSPRKASRCH